MFNKADNASICFGNWGSIVIRDYDNPWPDLPTKNAEIVVSRSTFHSNGNQIKPQHERTLVGVLFCFLYAPLTLNIVIEYSNFSSNGILGMYVYDNANNSHIAINNVIVFNNSRGGVEIVSHKSYMILDIVSSQFIQNNNGALVLGMNNNKVLNFKETTFARNIGTHDSQGAALYINAISITTVDLYQCYFNHNIALDGDSIIYIAANGLSFPFLLNVDVLVNLSTFVNNQLGSVLHVSQVMLSFHNSTLFQSNSAETGTAIYLDKNSSITVNDKSLVQFVNNTASLRGGGIYSNCFSDGTLFNNLSNLSAVMFISNKAMISGNSIYLNILTSCNLENKNNFIPYKFNYTQSNNTTGSALATSPYRINLCSQSNCSLVNESCLITEKKMLGQSIYFNAIVCDYFDAVAEAVQFQSQCINCETKYRLLDNELLVNNRSPNKFEILAIDAQHDILNDTNITIEISSVLSDNHRELSARLYVTLSTCYNGFLFSTDSQKCECYKSSGKSIVQCQEDHAEITLGYWYGIIYTKHTASLCPIHYRDFNHRTETRRNYYILPRAIDDQCSSHRTGVVCSDCKPGYTLAYDSFDCININQCSVGMTVLVIGLTFLYWIIVVITLFVLTYYFSTQVSSGYFNGIIYFYGIVDILLASKLYIIDGLFYTVAILSSFAKLTPQFLGRLCITKGMDAIDQQFIHYSHTLCILLLLIGIVIIGKCSKNVMFYINRCIARVTFLILILSYSSVTSTSLQLLRGVQYDNDGVFVYLSPQLKYFTHRHALYATVALLCGLVMIVGLPVLLIIEPFLKNKLVCIETIKPLLSQFQDAYKDNYQWFAGVYLLHRLVIIVIVYFLNSDHDNLVYYIQTVCVVVGINYACWWPYKKRMLNVLDVAILFIMLLLTVTLNNTKFSKSTTAGFIYILVFIPVLLLFGMGFKKLFNLKLQKCHGTVTPYTIHRYII